MRSHTLSASRGSMARCARASWCLSAAASLQLLRGELNVSPSCTLATRWMFGNEYPAGSYKGVANVRWTCNAPCTSRNYLIQVLLPAPPMQLAMRRGSLTLQGTPALAGLACMDCPPLSH